MSRPEAPFQRSRQVLTAEPGPDSPTSHRSSRGHIEDDAVSNYESSTEDSLAAPVARTLLAEDPFSTDISKILFDSIGLAIFLQG